MRWVSMEVDFTCCKEREIRASSSNHPNIVFLLPPDGAKITYTKDQYCYFLHKLEIEKPL